MQRQTFVVNLFVEFRFQLFNMKTLFYFELRVSADMIENIKTRDITLIPTTFRSTKMFKNGEQQQERTLLNVKHPTTTSTSYLISVIIFPTLEDKLLISIAKT